MNVWLPQEIRQHLCVMRWSIHQLNRITVVLHSQVRPCAMKNSRQAGQKTGTNRGFVRQDGLPRFCRSCPSVRYKQNARRVASQTPRGGRPEPRVASWTATIPRVPGRAALRQIYSQASGIPTVLCPQAAKVRHNTQCPCLWLRSTGDRKPMRLPFGYR